MPRMSMLVVLLSGCAVSTTVTAARTSPQLVATSRALPAVPSRSVLVLSALTLESVSAELVFSPCSLGPAACATRGLELQLAPREAERVLFDAGWEPLTQAQVAHLVVSSPVARGLRELLARGQATLLEAAVLLVSASTAEVVVVVSDWRPGFVTSQAQATGYTLCPLAGFLEMAAHDKQGRQLWEGRVTVQSTDTADVSLTATNSDASLMPPGLACATRAGCGECVGPVDPRESQTLIGRASHLLTTELLARRPVVP